jgi:hypothetical protein
MKVPRRDPTENERAPVGECAPVDAGDPEEEAEYVFEKIVGVRQMADGTLRYLVLWYGYGRDSDTWEPANHLPELAVRRYRRRTRLPYSQQHYRHPTHFTQGYTPLLPPILRTPALNHSATTYALPRDPRALGARVHPSEPAPTTPRAPLET